MGSKLSRVALAAVFLWAALSATAGRAATLLPGGDVVPTMMADDPNNSTILADTGFVNFEVTQNGVSLMGLSRSSVRSHYASNPFGPDALTFIYQVVLISTSPDAQSITSLILSGFSNVQTDVGFYQESGLIDPTHATRTEGPGSSINFHFADGALAKGTETSILVVNTNARSYHPGELVIQGGAVLVVPSFGAAALVPEPASIVAATTALTTFAALGARRRFRSTRGA